MQHVLVHQVHYTYMNNMAALVGFVINNVLTQLVRFLVVSCSRNSLAVLAAENSVFACQLVDPHLL
jgi:hypothetical protein